ncbi:hypothetical protein BSKO_09133 [Bryopsis sp. KO-2023]|nr:hypothetical protein BSKO_09133 [Bryopsis sp. KO-2023]
MSRQTISDLLGLQGPHAVMQRVRESTERYGGGVELLTAKLNCCDYRQKVSTSGLVDWTTLCLSVHCSLAFAATAGSNTTSDSSMKVSEWLARGSDLGSFFGRDRREYPNHTRSPGYSRHYCAMWDRQGPSSVDYQPYANLGAAWNTSSNAARARALLQGAKGRPQSPRAGRDEPSEGRQSLQGDSSGGSSETTRSPKIPAPSNGALLEQTKVVKKQLEELRESHFLSKCRNLLGVSDFSAQPPHHTQPQVQESCGEGAASSKRPVHIAKGVELDGASRECDSGSARTGSVQCGDKLESMDEFEASDGSDHCSLPRNVEVALAASLDSTRTSNVSEDGQEEWPQRQASDLTEPLRPPEPQVVRHIYRYAHYDEFGSDESRGDESSMHWLESGDEDYKTDEFDEKGHYSSFDDGPSDDQNEGRTPHVDGRMGNSCEAKELYKSKTSTDNDLRAQFNRENCWASDGGHRKKFTAIPVPSTFSASRSAQTKLRGDLGESQDNVNSVTAGGNRNVLESSSSEGCKKASDKRECLKSMSIDTKEKIGSERKSHEEASLPVSDQENKAFSDGEKPQATEAIQKDSDTTTHPSVRAFSVLRDSRNLENEKEVVKARTAEIQAEIRESLRDSKTSTDKLRKETEITNACTVGIQTERESLIFRKTETANKQEKVRLDTSTQTSSKEPIPPSPKEKRLDGTEFDLKDQQSGAEWLSEIIPKEILDRFALEGIKSTTTNVVPDQFHLHLHFAEKETLRDAKVETKNRGAEVERDAKQPLQTSIQNFHQEEDRQPSILKESSSGVPPAWPPNPDSDGGGEQVENGEASWDVLRSLCKTMGDTVQEACQKMSESEPTTDTDQSTETPRRPIMGHDFRPRRAQEDRNQSSRYMRTEAPGLQDSYQRDGYYNRVDSHEGFHNEAHYIRERERSQLKRQQNGHNGKSRRNMSPRDSRSRDFHDSTHFVEEFDRRYHNGFSGQAMERFASNQRGMNVYPPRGAERYPRYTPQEHYFQPADHHGQYPESFESDLNSLPSIFSPAVVDRSVHEVEERWRVHQEHLMNKIRQANSGSSGQPSRSGRSRYAASRNGKIPRRIHEEKSQSGRERSSSSELQRVARDMAMLASRLQNGSRK